MREIKFRAWTGKRFWYFDICSGFNAENSDYFKGPEQYTGLKDKFDVEIYEGDIIEFFGEYASHPTREVLFNCGFLTYTILSKQEKEWVEKGSNHYKYCYQEGNERLYFLNELESYQIMVRGNIHENPELLNKG